jgi:hypothetical protein
VLAQGDTLSVEERGYISSLSCLAGTRTQPGATPQSHEAFFTFEFVAAAK